MEMKEVVRTIEKVINPKGYRVSFERKEGNFLISDHFPDKDEPLIDTESEAWILARTFARSTVGKCVNIYVVNDNYTPVAGYRDKIIINRGDEEATKSKFMKDFAPACFVAVEQKGCKGCYFEKIHCGDNCFGAYCDSESRPDGKNAILVLRDEFKPEEEPDGSI